MEKQTNNKSPTTASPSSWADRVRVTDSSTGFTLDNIPRQPVGSRLKISEEMLMDNAEQWQRCMIGFFPGFKMPFHMVNSIASRVWRQSGLEDVMTTSNGFLIFRFKSVDDMQVVLEKGPWMFGGKTIILQQWHPRFCFDKRKISTLPVWVRIHGLPFPLWSKQGLSLAVSMVGRPLACDERTYRCTRLEYARVCVEIDASLPFVHNFEIDSPLSADPISIAVEYKWRPPRCELRKVFGHACPTRQSKDTNQDQQTPTLSLPHPHQTNPTKSLAKLPSCSHTIPTPKSSNTYSLETHKTKHTEIPESSLLMTSQPINPPHCEHIL